MTLRKFLSASLMPLALIACLMLALSGVASASDSVVIESALDTESLFSDRDLNQTPDLEDAVTYTLQSGEDITIDAEGVYVLTGEASDVTVYVEAGDEDKVQLVLDGVTVVNSDRPFVWVTGGDKVFVTTAADSELSVTGEFGEDGDAVIFSRSDLVLNGTASLTVASTDNGVVSKDDLKITGGSYSITAASKCLTANDSIRIAEGSFLLSAGADALHAENDDDDSLGYIYIRDGSFDISAGDDGIHGTSVVQIDGGGFHISAAEGIEGTYIQINDGVLSIDSWDDGINGAAKSSAYWPTIEINGGEITVVMASGDTDGIDCNGNLIINGGIVDVTGQSTFDYDGSGQYNGGTLIVNGEQVSALPNQMGMGGRGGGHGRF